ncbi:hypothetical protein VTL71DRAFT_586 [Oculimacula yallundae]|uniref:Uncharacterized protein n=1 Tax=Oculimacula yallundae TaxID=86028 RepID=A0ABR4D0H4_9HELO
MRLTSLHSIFAKFPPLAFELIDQLVSIIPPTDPSSLPFGHTYQTLQFFTFHSCLPYIYSTLSTLLNIQVLQPYANWALQLLLFTWCNTDSFIHTSLPPYLLFV